MMVVLTCLIHEITVVQSGRSIFT